MDRREQIERIDGMEERLNESLAAVRALDQALEDYRNRLEDIRALEDYLSGPEWRTDLTVER